MPTGTKGGYDKARETYAKDKSGGGNGFFSGVGASIDRGVSNIGKAFSGLGGGGKSNPTSSQRPPTRPAYTTQGSNYVNTRTGATTPVPDYSPFSLRGLTSNDPGNVIRNQMAAQRYASMPQSVHQGGNRGIASLAPHSPTSPSVGSTTSDTTAPVPTVPTTPELPVVAQTAGYSPAGPAMGYGSAFAGLSQPMANPYGGMSLMDIFSMYPDLRYM
jgi:hypothetical protein